MKNLLHTYFLIALHFLVESTFVGGIKELNSKLLEMPGSSLTQILFLKKFIWKKWCFTQIIVEQFTPTEASPLPSFFICLRNQLSSINSIVSNLKNTYICLKNVIHQINSKNERLLFSVSFTTKVELVFVLIQESTFS